MALAGSALLMAALLTVDVPSSGTTARASSTSSINASRQASAMLEDLNLPTQTQRSEAEPAAAEGELPTPTGSRPSSPLTVHVHAYWTLNASVQEVISWATSHYRHGASIFSQGGSASSPAGAPLGVAAPAEQSVGFGWEPQVGPIAQRFLDLSLITSASGLTVVRADVYVVPRVLRPTSERIPPTAQIVRITAVAPFGDGHQRASIPPILITDFSTVRAIAKAIDALPRLQPGVYNCPPDNGSSISFTFRAFEGGLSLAQVKAAPTGCGTVEVWIGQRSEPALTDGYRLVRRVEKLLGPAGGRLPRPL